MATRLLLIDENVKFRNSVKRSLAREIPDLVVYEYDPNVDGIPTRNFNWQTYELVMLDHKWAKAHDMGWLREIKNNPEFPALIMFIGSRWGAANEARMLGADETLKKRELTPAQLTSTIDFALRYAQTRRKHHDLEMRESTGPSIPGYRIINKLAEGGMSSIYLARREQDNEMVVIKILYSESIEDETFVDRFLKEYELISKINDPNVLKIYEESYSEEFMYMVLEYFPNGDLHRRIAAKQGLPLATALQYLIQIATGLQAIHSRGVIHRDLKPSNIMFRADDSLAIIDFGISKELAIADELTSDNMVMGTVGYMSPEAGQGKKVDARSDFYSLGIIFYEMLTGKKPYIGRDPADVVLKHVKAPIPWLPEKYKQVQGLFEIMVAKDPDNRFQSATRLIEFVESRFADLLAMKVTEKDQSVSNN
ncbi:MAG: serine/threonine protein kinase [Gammaproteobacteria bacterium]|nr:serine/threonine protein kinase [Gammaproteobacteria bacterium]